MIPLMLDPGFPVLLAGRAARILGRLDLVEASGAMDVKIFSDAPSPELVARAGERLRPGLPQPADIAAARLLFVADLDDASSRALALAARVHRVPVNVEDVPALCDFHVPATVRRGKLLLTVSTGGAAPGAAARIRAELEQRFDAGWATHLDHVAEARAGWRGAGLPQAEVARRVSSLIEESGWLLPAAPPESSGSLINAF